MLQTAMAPRGMVVAPHNLAAESGLAILREGGNAIEAVLAAAATIAVVYPHMNGIGGDGFWLVHVPGWQRPIGIDASGAAGALALPALYAGRKSIPSRGPLAAITVPGALSGWAMAQQLAAEIGGHMDWRRLLADAIHYAEIGFPITRSQSRDTAAKLEELRPQPGFADTFLVSGWPPAPGARQVQPALGQTLRRIAANGPLDAYTGLIARTLVADLRRVGSPLGPDDLQQHRARRVDPLEVRIDCAGVPVRVFNLPPPTQGLATLAIIGQFAAMQVREADGFAHVHGIVEATKTAFKLRDRTVTDPARSKVGFGQHLDPAAIQAMLAEISPTLAAPWPPTAQGAPGGDTVWIGAIDRSGVTVSYIQSLYWEFGSGVVLPETGIVMQNRGITFSLDAGALNPLEPGRKPFHTLNPSLALFQDGRQMSFGCMGGEGQPQTQAAVFSRYAAFGQTLQQAITAPRWLLGRSWGAESITLKLENRFDPALIAALKAAGHDVETVDGFSQQLGHAGALVRTLTDHIEAAADPRSDGIAAGF